MGNGVKRLHMLAHQFIAPNLSYQRDLILKSLIIRIGPQIQIP